MESGIFRIPSTASVYSILGLKERQMTGLGEGPLKENQIMQAKQIDVLEKESREDCKQRPGG